MPIDFEQMVSMLQDLVSQQKDQISSQQNTITELNATIRELQGTIANLNETIDELKRKIYGRSREKLGDPSVEEASESQVPETALTTTVKGHTRIRKKKSCRDELYDKLPVQDINVPALADERICPDCGADMEHLGYVFDREELRIIPAKVFRVRYMKEKLVCPACREEDVTTITEGSTPAPLMAHSPASPSMVASVMYQKCCLYLPFYRQEDDWIQKGAPIPRETQANWFNKCAERYLKPIYDALHKELLSRDVIHADEVPCQVLHEEDKTPESKSYMWIYLSGTDGKAPVVLYEYQPGRGGQYPVSFLDGFSGMVHCDGYSAYGKLSNVILVCCVAHCRRKFYEAVPAARRRQIKLLDINSEQEIQEPSFSFLEKTDITPAEKGVLFCNMLFYKERILKNLSFEERRIKRLEEEIPIWDEFWKWLDTLDPTGGSKLEKAVKYAHNHKEQFMNYLKDGRCELSNNAAERKAKTYVMGRKNFLFHDTVTGANASAIVLSLAETAKANNLNVFQYLYMLLLYMPDYKNEPAGISQLMPWSDFIQERCSGLSDTETITPENREDLPV